MNTSNISKQEFEDLIKIVEDLLRRVEMATHRLETSFAEFRELFSLILKSSFVDQAAKELLQESFLRLEDRMKNDLSDNDNSCTDLKNWFSFYLGTTISESEDRSAKKFGASSGQ
jgi:exonuclease VII small subunit